MNTIRRSGEARMHEEISMLIPWYVNGSVSEIDRQRVDAHLLQCAQCRNDLTLERGVYEGMSADTGVEYMPAASLKRLQARLDGLVTEARVGEGSQEAFVAVPRRRVVTWQGVMAASVAIMAVAVSLLAADRWTQSRTRAAASYYTVTTAAPRVSNEVIRAVFIPTITLVELQSVLDEAGLRIISGPTEAGVYSLAANSRRPVSSSLALLRGHAKVRFAESIQSSTGPGATP
jgi:hypothetical protein